MARRSRKPTAPKELDTHLVCIGSGYDADYRAYPSLEKALGYINECASDERETMEEYIRAYDVKVYEIKSLLDIQVKTEVTINVNGCAMEMKFD